MEILLSNDDGVGAAGLNNLAMSLKEIAQIYVVAPDRDRSGSSNSLSLTRPLRATSLPNGFVSVDGTPTDCVHLAITGWLDVLPDMVISGINHGANLGDDIIYSGTVAAATEGRFLGYPAIAVSLAAEYPQHFDTASYFVKQIVKYIMQNPLPKDIILNVNIPDLAVENIQGIEITRCGNRHKAEPIIKMNDPRGRRIYWIGPAGSEADSGCGTDFNALHHDKVSITPLRIDMTDHNAIPGLQNWIQNFIL